MTDNEIDALIESGKFQTFIQAEVARQLANTPRVVPKDPKDQSFSDFLKPAIHREISSNQPGKPR